MNERPVIHTEYGVDIYYEDYYYKIYDQEQALRHAIGSGLTFDKSFSIAKYKLVKLRDVDHSIFEICDGATCNPPASAGDAVESNNLDTLFKFLENLTL